MTQAIASPGESRTAEALRHDSNTVTTVFERLKASWESGRNDRTNSRQRPQTSKCGSDWSEGNLGDLLD